MTKFHCNVYHCDLPQSDCVNRQKTARSPVSGPNEELASLRFSRCANCPQGQSIALDLGARLPQIPVRSKSHGG